MSDPVLDSSSNSSSGSGCPVKHGTNASSSWWSNAVFGGSPQYSDSPHSTNSKSPIPASIEEAARYSQTPLPDQRAPLSTFRTVSSIPRADEMRMRPVSDTHKKETTTLSSSTFETTASTSITNSSSSSSNSSSSSPHGAAPHHQPPNSEYWVYPSEQQFYHAMRRKGYSLENLLDPSSSNHPMDESHVIPYIVRIHNAVNERCWSEICRWERDLHQNDNPRLIRFTGRPKDLSPKAWFNSRIFMKKEPFDRHDWIVDCGDGKKERRYVIDFYNGQEQGTSQVQKDNQHDAFMSSSSSPSPSPALHTVMKPPSMYLDVRPALDSPLDLYDRVRMFVRDAFPGIVSLSSSSVQTQNGASTVQKNSAGTSASKPDAAK